MEGIDDGQARDDCFVCGLLFPREHAESCPNCDKRMRYRPAALLRDAELQDRIQSLAIAYQRADRRGKTEKLIELLVTLHEYAPIAIEILERDTELKLRQLRRHWQGR